MQKCKVCDGTDFYKEAGYFFCKQCQTQNDEIREEVLDLRIDNTTRLRKTRIKESRSDEKGEETGWTSWELYNIVLIGLTNELIELGVPSEIKLTILQLWATYLGKVEIAFISTKEKVMPKLARGYKKKDAEIIYGKTDEQKTPRKRRRSSTNNSIASGGLSDCSSSMRELNRSKKLLATADYDRYLQSQDSSEGDALSMYSQSQSLVSQASSTKSTVKEGKVKLSSHAKEEAEKVKELSKDVPRAERVEYRKKHVTSQYRNGPHVVTPMRLWAIIYIALRIHDQPIHLGDMLRYGKEGHLSYYKLEHFIPAEINLTPVEKNYLTQHVELTCKGMRRMVANMAKLIGVWDFVCPDLLSLVNRYCQELGLPRGIFLYVERLLALSPPKMKFDSKSPLSPNYEGRAIAFIIVAMKVLLALDGVTEYQISRIAEKINSMIIKRDLKCNKLFSFREWQGYIECRKTILSYAHYPTRMKYIPESNGVDNTFLKFLEFVNSKCRRETEEDATAVKNSLPTDLIVGIKKYLSDLDTKDLSPQAIEIFPPSLTPLSSYFKHLIDHPYYRIPELAKTDFFHTVVGYMTKPKRLIELAMKCDLQLEIVDKNVHFLEKKVPPFEQARLPTVAELNELVIVEDDTKDENSTPTESLNDYLHSKMPCTIEIDMAKKQYYDIVESKNKSSEGITLAKDFTFTETLPNGRLAIPDDSDDEDVKQELDNNNLNGLAVLLDAKFCDKYNIQLSRPERESIFKPDVMPRKRHRKVRPKRNKKGQFVKSSTVKDSGESSTMKIDQDESVDKTDDSQDLLLLNEDIDINDIDIDHMHSAFFKENEFTFFPGENDSFPSTSMVVDDSSHKFFRPFKEYWMYHCIFSRVKAKNFAEFERSLPASFRWLLNECALITEMPTEDLYEEVCLIESYYSHILGDKMKRLPKKPIAVYFT